ncbi:MAG: TMEM165/GDT1 family protein [Kiritimatiellia bacterium]
MDARLFISTFLLIFLAELGDKTQLTAMARAAGTDGGKWTVFAAAGCALLLSTLLAVTLGRVISRFVPEHVVKLLAAVLFLCFGTLLLISALRHEKVPAPAEIPPPATGIMMRTILRIAAEFEEAAAGDYAALAKDATDPALQQLLRELEIEEREHLDMMLAASQSHAHIHLEPIAHSDLPSTADLQHDVAASDRPILTHAIEHEKATRQFYLDLAHRTPIPALRRTFTYLAEAERAHVQRLEALLHPPAA